MSTKSTIARIADGAWLVEEMLDETTWLELVDASFQLDAVAHTSLRLKLSPAVIDKIAAVHAASGFPHQWQRRCPTCGSEKRIDAGTACGSCGCDISNVKGET